MYHQELCVYRRHGLGHLALRNTGGAVPSLRAAVDRLRAKTDLAARFGMTGIVATIGGFANEGILVLPSSFASLFSASSAVKGFPAVYSLVNGSAKFPLYLPGFLAYSFLALACFARLLSGPR